MNNCCYYYSHCTNGKGDSTCLASCKGIKDLCSNEPTGTCICKPVSPCDNQPCKNGGTCIVKGNSYECKCKGDYGGPTCEQILCNGTVCPPNSSCIDNSCKCNNCFTNNNKLTTQETVINQISISNNTLRIIYKGAPSPSSCIPITPKCKEPCPKGKICVCDPATGQNNCKVNNKVLQGYLCGVTMTAEQIINSGFNYVVLSFYKIVSAPATAPYNIEIVGDQCCSNDKEDNQYKKIATDLIQAGVTVGISLGGDGCAGYDDSLATASEKEIVDAFERLRTNDGINYGAIDIDWETCSEEKCIGYINKIGKAISESGKDYFVSLVPMSSQFTPQGYMYPDRWSVKLNPDYFHHVMIQWYEGGCQGTQTCPCWGNSKIIKESCPTDPKVWHTKKYTEELQKRCGSVQWLKAFSNGGNSKGSQWPSDKIVIGAKSWCNGDTPAPCKTSDTGIWSANQISDIIDEMDGKIGGVGLWDLNDYYAEGYNYTNTGNPMTNECEFGQIISKKLGINPNLKATKDCSYNMSGC